MKTMIVLITICLVGTTCKKSESPSGNSELNKYSIQLLDTLTMNPVQNCKVYLCSLEHGIRQILTEKKSDSSGFVRFESIEKGMTMICVSNDYAWKESTDITQPQIFLYPYVTTYVNYEGFDPNYQNKLDGSFNEAPLYPIGSSGTLKISSAVFVELTLYHIRYNTKSSDTICYKQETKNQINHLDIP